MDDAPTNPPAISVRHMRAEESAPATSPAGRAIPRRKNAFISPPSQTLLAERERRRVGPVVPKVFDLPHRRRCGALFWLMTDLEVVAVRR